MDIGIAAARDGAFAIVASKGVTPVDYLLLDVAGAGKIHVELGDGTVDGSAGRATQIKFQLVGLDTAVEIRSTGYFYINLLSHNGKSRTEVGSAGKLNTLQIVIVRQNHFHLSTADSPAFEIDFQCISILLYTDLRHDVVTRRDDCLAHLVADGDFESVLNL